MENSDEFNEKARRIVLLAMDCDGVLTDGRLYYGQDGEALKVFHVHDGQGIVNWREAGFKTAVITARSSEMLAVRAKELKIDFLVQGTKNKAAELQEICKELEIELKECAFIGDDLADIPAMEVAGVAFSVADAMPEVKAVATVVASKNGGAGAVREVINMLLNAKNYPE